MRTRALFLSGALSLTFGTSAGAARGPGTTAANFLNIDLGPRPVALGGAFTGLADDVNAIAYNPAGLAGLTRQELAFMHHEYVSGVRQEWLAYAFPSRKYGTFAASVNALYIEPFASYDQFDRPTGKTSAADTAFHLAYANTFNESLSWGAGATYLRSHLNDRSATATAFDGGLLYRAPGRLGVGVAVQNLGTKMKFVEEAYALPATYRGGLSYAAWKGGVNEVTLAADLAARSGRGNVISGGVEYVRAGMLAVRAGGQSGRDTGPGYSCGVGVRLNRDHATLPEVAFDYAFVDFGTLSLTHRAGITLRWGGEPAKPAPERAEKAPPPPAAAEASGAEGHFARAQSHIQRREYDEARVELEIAASFLPDEDRRRVFYLERMGLISLKEGRMREARERYAEALRISGTLGIRDESVANAYAGMGEFLIATKDLPGAIKYLNKALEVGPSPAMRRSVEARLQQLKEFKKGEKP